MSRVAIQSLDQAAVVPFPALRGVNAQGSVESRRVVGAPERSLCLWEHQLAPGATLNFAAPLVGHVLFVKSGSVSMEGRSLAPRWVLIVEHQGGARVEAGADGAVLLHFHQSEDLPPMTSKAGGNVHVVPPEGVVTRNDTERGTAHSVFSTSHCPTCDLWLHRTSISKPRPPGGAHRHSADEIIVVTDGQMLLGRARPAGTVIAIEADTVYGFGVPEQGLSFINFRAVDSGMQMIDRGKPNSDWFSEWEYINRHAEIVLYAEPKPAAGVKAPADSLQATGRD